MPLDTKQAEYEFDETIEVIGAGTSPDGIYTPHEGYERPNSGSVPVTGTIDGTGGSGGIRVTTTPISPVPREWATIVERIEARSKPETWKFEKVILASETARGKHVLLEKYLTLDKNNKIISETYQTTITAENGYKFINSITITDPSLDWKGMLRNTPFITFKDGHISDYQPGETHPPRNVPVKPPTDDKVHELGFYVISKILVENFPSLQSIFGEGSELNDNLTGGAFDDLLFGQGGNDILHGLNGDDILFGGDGNDTIWGGAGDDVVYGGDGDDFMSGEDGNDKVYGGSGNDQLFGYYGNDVLEGGDGHDQLAGEWGDDILRGGNGNDTLFGGDGNDVLEGGDGDDFLIGGTGNDTLNGGAGNDRLHGQEGNDFLIGGLGDDTLYGEEGNDRLHGQEGNDTLYGGEGDDTLSGEEGNDTVIGGLGNDVIYGGDGDDLLAGEAGNDLIRGGSGNDTIWAGWDDDTLYGEDGNDAIFGEGGNDNVWAGSGDDIIDGGDGNDMLRGNAGNDRLTGGAGADMFIFDWDAPLNSATNVDTITDFTHGEDKLWLASNLFGAMGGPLGQAGGQITLTQGTSAVGSKAQLIYDRASGDLWYDADGVGGQDAIKFAHLSNHAELSASDFFLF